MHMVLSFFFTQIAMMYFIIALICRSNNVMSLGSVIVIIITLLL